MSDSGTGFRRVSVMDHGRRIGVFGPPEPAMLEAYPTPLAWPFPPPRSARSRVLGIGKTATAADVDLRQSLVPVIGAGTLTVQVVETAYERHLIEQPTLGLCGPGTGLPASTWSIAACSRSPVTGLPLPGVDSSNAPR